MATGRVNSFTFDFKPAEALAQRLDSVADGVLLRLAAVDAVNEVATRFDAQARKDMNLGLNLSDDYISSRMQITRATASGSGPTRAEIVTRGDLTIIGHYPHRQLRAAGTQMRAGPSRGRRPSGVAVEIRRGVADYQPQWFTMRLRAGSAAGDKVGLFVRTSANKTKHIYGPSPYSLFRHQIETNSGEVADDLERTALTAAADALTKALT